MDAKKKGKSKSTGVKEPSEKKKSEKERIRLFLESANEEINDLERQKQAEGSTQAQPAEPSVETPASAPQPELPPEPAAPKRKGFGKKSSSIIYDRYSYINYVNSLLKR
jgi:hypothetical protein